MLNPGPSIGQQEDAPLVMNPQSRSLLSPDAVVPQAPVSGTLVENHLSHDIDVMIPEDVGDIELGQEIIDLLPDDDNLLYQIDDKFDFTHEYYMAEPEKTLLASDDEEIGTELASDGDAVKINDELDLGFIESNYLAKAANRVPVIDELTTGQEFPDVTSCRRALRDMAIALHFEIKTVYSDKKRFTAECASEGCPWRVHAAKLRGVPTFSIRTLNSEHNCNGIAHPGHRQASVQWVADSVERLLRENPNCKPKDLSEVIYRTHDIALPYKKAWRGKERVKDGFQALFEEEYRLLPRYCDQIRQTNPGSTALVSVNPTDGTFERLFVSYHASIYGFLKACRPLIWLGGTILKNRYAGSMLYATGFDAEGDLNPLAFGVVMEENKESWGWFVSELRKLLETTNSQNMPRLTILSNRRKMIVLAVELNFPTAFHGFCMHQLIESFKKDFNNTSLIDLFWEAERALTIAEFDNKIQQLESMSPQAGHWVRMIPSHLWAHAHFKENRWGCLDVNVAESMNSWMIQEASKLPIIKMMEEIRLKLMTCYYERRQRSTRWGDNMQVVPSARERLLTVNLEKDYTVCESRGGHVVTCIEGQDVFVDIRTRRCRCHAWQLYGVPCSHAAAALSFCNLNVYQFVESCFNVSSYRDGYSQPIYPIRDPKNWQASQGGELALVVNPPKSLGPPAARPGKRRARKAHNSDRVKRNCRRCGQPGHFQKTCNG